MPKGTEMLLFCRVHGLLCILPSYHKTNVSTVPLREQHYQAKRSHRTEGSWLLLNC